MGGELDEGKGEKVEKKGKRSKEKGRIKGRRKLVR